MNQPQSEQKIISLFRKSGLPIGSKEGIKLFEKLMKKHFVRGKIDQSLVRESNDLQFSPRRMKKLHQEITEIKKKIFARAKSYDQNKRN